MASVWYSIMDAIKDAIVALGLTGVSDANVKVRMLPKVGETLDTLPSILIAPGSDPETIEQFTFEDACGIKATYPVDVVIVAASNRDFSTNLDTYLTWRQSIRRAFQGNQIPGVTETFLVGIRPEPAFDRSLLQQQYAYSGLSIDCSAVEPRGN